jgi:flavin reductase (DIM6/NTAB) family NADH-FMN oxidoreductase RutF
MGKGPAPSIRYVGYAQQPLLATSRKEMGRVAAWVRGISTYTRDGIVNLCLFGNLFFVSLSFMNKLLFFKYLEDP